MVNSNYDDYLNNILKSLDVEFNKRRDILAQTLVGRGLGRSPIIAESYKQLQSDYMNQLGTLVPQLRLKQQETEQGQENWQKQFGLQQEEQTMQGSQFQQELEERRRQAMLNEMYRQREMALQEAQLSAQKEAYEKSQSEWWKPILGQILGYGGGMVLGGWGNKLFNIGQTAQNVTQPSSLSYYPQNTSLGGWYNPISLKTLQDYIYNPQPIQTNKYKLLNNLIGGIGGNMSSPSYKLGGKL